MTATVPGDSGSDSAFDVKTYGAQGDGSHDDTTACQAAITAAAASGAVVFFPAGTYKITAPLSIPGGSGGFTTGGITLRGAHRQSSCIEQATANTAIIVTGDAAFSQNVTIEDLRLQMAAQASTSDTAAYGISWDGNPAVVVSWTIRRCWINRCYVGLGISATSGAVSVWNLKVSDTWITSTRHSAVKLRSPTIVGAPSNYFEHLYVANTGVGGVGGAAITSDGSAFDFVAAEVTMTDIDLEGWCNTAVTYNGTNQPLTVRNFYIEWHQFNDSSAWGANPVLFDLASDAVFDGVWVGATTAASGLTRFFNITASTLYVRAGGSNITISSGTAHLVWTGGTERVYYNNDWRSVAGALVMPGTAGSSNPADLVGGARALTYSGTIATDASKPSDTYRIVATNGTAFTISNPTNPTEGRKITYDIKNGSGGAMGVVTWGAAFLLAGVFTNPANTKRRTISFYFDGTNWVETNRAAADI